VATALCGTLKKEISGPLENRRERARYPWRNVKARRGQCDQDDVVRCRRYTRRYASELCWGRGH